MINYIQPGISAQRFFGLITGIRFGAGPLLIFILSILGLGGGVYL